jgi:hypothetical protein
LPLRYPLLEKPRIVALHELKATVKARFYPASDIGQAVRHHPASLFETAINGCGIPILKTLDHHKEHIASFHLNRSAVVLYETRAVGKGGAIKS